MSSNTSPIEHVEIVGNLLAGGGYSLYCNAGPDVRDEIVTGNRFAGTYHRAAGAFGPTAGCEDADTFDGNLWDATAEPVDEAAFASGAEARARRARYSCPGPPDGVTAAAAALPGADAQAIPALLVGDPLDHELPREPPHRLPVAGLAPLDPAPGGGSGAPLAEDAQALGPAQCLAPERLLQRQAC